MVSQTKKTFQKNGGQKKHTHTHPPLKPPRVRDDFGVMIVSPPPDKSPRIFWDLVWVFLQFGGIWVLNPQPAQSWDLNPLGSPNEDVVAARKDDLISKWLGTRRDQPLQEAQEAQAPPKPEPRRLDSMGGSISFLGS